MKNENGDNVVDQVEIETDMVNPPDLASLKEDYASSRQYHQSVCNRIDHWKAVLAAEKSASLKKRKGRSKFVAKLARRQAEWTYSDISEPFLNAPNLFAITGQTGKDVEAAKQNSIILNNQINNQIDKTFVMDSIAHVLVDEGTVVLRAIWNYEEGTKRVEVPDYSFIPIAPNDPLVQMYEQIGQVSQQGQMPPNLPPSLIAGFKASLKAGVPVRAEQKGTRTVNEKYTKHNEPDIRVLSLKDVVVDPNAGGSISKAKFVIYEFEISKSQMLVDGNYHNIDALPEPMGHDVDVDSMTERDDKQFSYNDSALKLYHAKEYWGYGDIDGTGIVQPFICTWIAGIMVKLQRHALPEIGIPFEIIKYMEVFGENYGEPDTALIEDNQKMVSVIMRGMVDTLARSSTGQRAVRDNMLDPINYKRFLTGQDFKTRGSVAPEQIFHTFKYPELGNSGPYMMDIMNREAESLSGTQPFGADGQKSTQSVGGQKLALDATIKRKMSIIRRVTAGLVSIGRKIIAMNAVFLDEEETVRITDKEFVKIKRDDLAGRFDLQMTVSTAERDEVKASELSFMLQTNGPSDDPQEKRIIRAKIARLRNMHDLADQISAYQPTPDPLQVATAEAELELIRAQIKDAEGRAHENFANGEYDLMRVKTEELKQSKLQAEIALLDLDFIEVESGVKQERAKELAKVNHRNNSSNSKK